MDTILTIPMESQEEYLGEEDVSLWLVESDFVRPSTKLKVRQELQPGLYTVDLNREYGIFCKNLKIESDELYVFNDPIIKKMVEEIDSFWDKSILYKENKLLHKRGILLEGPPGVGKTSLITLLSQKVIENKGIVFKINGKSNLYYYTVFIKDYFRKIQPNTPIITIIEDINEYGEVRGELLDFLDGKNNIEHNLTIATTNNTLDLDDAFLRPSRLDLRILVDNPSKEVREQYFKFKNVEEAKIKELVKVSDCLSLADLKELYICHFLLDYSLEDAIEKINKTVTKKNYNSGNKKESSFLG